MHLNKARFIYILNILIPCVIFSAITGTASAVLIFIFKLSAGKLSELSGEVYSFVRADLTRLPLLVLCAALLGLVAGVVLRASKDCRGGGIPAAIAALRGFVPFARLRSIITIFLSSMITYLCGIPLGTEGPSVQMGTLLGKLTSKLSGKKHLAWERYIMTGGACSGFAAATGAPLSGIFFAFEEAHRRFSPMIFMISAMTVLFGALAGEIIALFTGISPSLFHFEELPALPLGRIWLAFAVGLVCGVCAMIFTKAYSFIRIKTVKKIEALPFTLEFALIFGATALIGFFSGDSVGSGHELIEKLMEGHGVWYALILCFGVRALLLIISNTQGVTGGLFIPTLAFGAIIGAVCGKLSLRLGVLEEEFFPVIVVIGMVSFLSASSRTPITALVFAIEALSGMANLLPVGIGVTIAYVAIELVGIPSFTDAVIEGKTEEYNSGLVPVTVEMQVTVKENAFVIGKEVRDILWPAGCTVLSVKSEPSTARIGIGMAEGDLLSIRFRSAHPRESAVELEALVGRQEHDICSEIKND